MQINIKSLYQMARSMPFDHFETVLKSTIANVPTTAYVDGELICEITVKKPKINK